MLLYILMYKENIRMVKIVNDVEFIKRGENQTKVLLDRMPNGCYKFK